jgi:hypothetical protein
MARWLTEDGLEAHAVETRYEGERDETGSAPVEAEP